MGEIKIPNKVLLISAICYHPNIDPTVIENALSEIGEIESRTRAFEFDHTHYYEHEMGRHLLKYYCTFKKYIDPSEIAEIKIKTNEIEERFIEDENRQINLDPGYIEVPKLILATTKNFSHRVYIGKGIYGDVQLVWKAGEFQFNPWTYPDYKEKEVVAFFSNARQQYYKELKKGKLL